MMEHNCHFLSFHLKLHNSFVVANLDSTNTVRSDLFHG